MARVTILVFSALLVLDVQIENANSNMLAKQIKKSCLEKFQPFPCVNQFGSGRQTSNYKQEP